MEITLSTVTYQDWKDIVKRAVSQAKRGNYQARKFLADYLIGPPTQRVDLGGGTDNRLIVTYVNDWREQHPDE